jgi:site-specific recombinase XerD
MLERYYIRPKTLDEIRSSWIAGPIEEYVEWLSKQGYAARNVFHRVPLLRHFGEFARSHGATSLKALPAHLEPFVASWVRERGGGCGTSKARRKVASDARNPVQQMLRLVVPGFSGRPKARWAREPFAGRASAFFVYLREERGLRDATLLHYKNQLGPFEAYVDRIKLRHLRDLTPAVLGGFIAESTNLGRIGLRDRCGVLRVFLRYLHRERLVPRDLSASVESPRAYRLSGLPRSISWDEVRRMLEGVDRRSAAGKRDYAILLLLITYGLRGREVAALTLDHLDWKRERLVVPERKAGHCTAYPLSPIVGNALLDYFQHGRPQTTDRHAFFRVLAPLAPLCCGAVSSRAAYYLHKAGIQAPRLGSHTLRHTCVQRLVDADFPFKVIGDYVGHRAAESTEIYTKVATEALREVALGGGEEIL